MAIQTLKRVFVHDDIELPDPGPNMLETEVLEFYANTYPELNVAYIESSELDEANATTRYKIALSVGTKA